MDNTFVDIDGLHPLLFPPVLSKIFNFLSFWNHKKCRLICKTWDQELLPYLRKASKINLTKLVNNISPEINGYKLLTQNLSKICTNFVIEDDSPGVKGILRYGSLRVKYLEIQNSKWDLYKLRSFILQDLPFLEELRLPMQFALQNSTQSNNLISPLKGLSKHSKLKMIIVTLTIKDLPYYDHQNTSILPLLQILLNTPNLEEIYYPNVVQFTSPYDNPARVLFDNILSNPDIQLRRLSTIKIDTFLCNQDLEVLKAKNFPLKSVQITLTPDISCKIFYSFLTCIEQTLKLLTLTFRDGFRLTSKFPDLKCLNRMSLILWNGYLDYAQDILQMKTLAIVLVEMEVSMICNSQTENFSNFSRIEEMDIHAVRNAKSDIVQKLIKLSPSVSLKRLTLDSVNDAQLQTIYLTLPHLEELVILYGRFTETGITGIPKTFCREEYCDMEFYAQGLKKYPGICDLKNLRSLVLTGELTDFIIILGVVRCRQLKKLELCAKHCSEVTDRSLKKIADVMKLDLLRMRNFAKITEAGLDSLKMGFAGREFHLNI